MEERMYYKKRMLIVSYDNICIFSIALYFFYLLSRKIINSIGFGNNYVSYLFLLLAYVLLFFIVLMKRTKALIASLTLLLFVFIVCLFSYFIHPENGNIIKQVFAFQYGISIVPFLCAIDNKDTMKKIVFVYCFITFLSCIFGMVTFFRNGGYFVSNVGNSVIHLSYNMTIGYEGVISGLLFIWIYKSSNKIFYLIFSIVAIGISLVWGSRGCLLCYAIYLIIFILTQKPSRKILYMSLVIILLLIVFIVIGIENVISLFLKIFSILGFSSRNFSGFTSFSSFINNDSGRRIIWNYLLEKVWEKPIVGYGIRGDNTLLSLYTGTTTFYSHNIFLELVVSFGIPVGMLLVLFLFQLIYRSIKRCPKELFGAFICMISYNIGNLIVSNTFWFSTGFWIMIGMSIYFNCNYQKYSDTEIS